MQHSYKAKLKGEEKEIKLQLETRLSLWLADVESRTWLQMDTTNFRSTIPSHTVSSIAMSAPANRVLQILLKVSEIHEQLGKKLLAVFT